ncbi:MAG: HNH endonuclease [Pirellulales bacterium]
MDNHTHWLTQLARLRIDTATNAPHKPLLLLVVLDIAQEGALGPEMLPLTPQLAFRFCSYWSIVAHRRKQKPDVRWPFTKLKTEGVWVPLDERGEPAADPKQARIAKLNAEFVAAANDPAFREQARRILIARYFEPAERVALYTLLGMPVPSDDQIAADANYVAEGDPRRKGRNVRFRIEVVAAYNYACALTGLRLTTISAGAIVDAAHIHQFADSRNDDPRNGMALCKNAHWLFDNGLWSLDDDYRVIIAADRFDEDASDQKSLKDYAGQRIRLPSTELIWPDPKHLAWHREKKFEGN